MLSFFGLFEPNINIGFVPDINPELQHGVAWMKIPGAGMEARPFTVDRPDHLNNPTAGIVHQMFHQIAKMGFFPDKIELIANDEYLVYEFGKSHPIIKQRAIA